MNPREVGRLSALVAELLDSSIVLIFASVALWAAVACWEKFRRASQPSLSMFPGCDEVLPLLPQNALAMEPAQPAREGVFAA